MKVALVIERDPESVKLVRAILELWDYAIISAPSIAVALELIRAAPPDVILCDIAAPVTEAFLFIRELRDSPDVRLKKMPVIATTASCEDVDARAVRAAGFDLFLRKPLDPDQLPHMVPLLIAASVNAAPPLGGA